MSFDRLRSLLEVVPREQGVTPSNTTQLSEQISVVTELKIPFP